MIHGNLEVVFTVIAVVVCVLGITLVATYCLNRIVDKADRQPVSEASDVALKEADRA